MQLKAVVLPEPLGPISAVMRRGATSNEQPSRAVTPPNDLLTSRTDSALPLVPDRPSTPASPLLIASSHGAGRRSGSRRPCAPRPVGVPGADGHEQPVRHEASDQEQDDSEQRQV